MAAEVLRAEEDEFLLPNQNIGRDWRVEIAEGDDLIWELGIGIWDLAVVRKRTIPAFQSLGHYS